jgi:hypothetical protein
VEILDWPRAIEQLIQLNPGRITMLNIITAIILWIAHAWAAEIISGALDTATA